MYNLKNLVRIIILLLSSYVVGYSQQVPILNYSTSSSDQVLLEVNSTINNYYILQVRHHADLFRIQNRQFSSSKTNFKQALQNGFLKIVRHKQILSNIISLKLCH